MFNFSEVKFVVKVVQTECSYISVSFSSVIPVTSIFEQHPISVYRQYKCTDVQNITETM